MDNETQNTLLLLGCSAFVVVRILLPKILSQRFTMVRQVCGLVCGVLFFKVAPQQKPLAKLTLRTAAGGNVSETTSELRTDNQRKRLDRHSADRHQAK